MLAIDEEDVDRETVLRICEGCFLLRDQREGLRYFGKEDKSFF